MNSYLNLLAHIMNTGTDRSDRTGVGTRSVFGYQWRHALRTGFPLLTTKKVHLRSIIHELLWFIRGETNIKYLLDNDVHIWDEWANPEGELGPVYGHQWRNFCGMWIPGIDQLAELVDSLRNNPDSRRHIVTAWNPHDLPQQALPACHTLFQCYASNGYLSLHLYARSIDSFLGLPFNIASYALLTHMLAVVCGFGVGDLIISFGDLHIYSNHFNQVRTQLGRMPRDLPTLLLHHQSNLEDFRFEDFVIEGYDPHPAIKAPVAV